MIDPSSRYCLIILIAAVFVFSSVKAQDTLTVEESQLMISAPSQFTQVPYFTFGKGVGLVSPDSIFSMNIRFRIQNRADLHLDDDLPNTIEGKVRRLRFDGFVYNI